MKAPLPQQGKAYFFTGVVQHGELYQDIDVNGYKWLTDLGLMTAHYSAYMRVFPQRPPDQSREVVEFRNTDSTILDSYTSMPCDSTNAWVQITDKRTMPKGTRTVRVRLLSDRFNGSNNDGYHDNLSFAVSLPWWIYLVVLIISALVLWRAAINKRMPAQSSEKLKSSGL